MKNSTYMIWLGVFVLAMSVWSAARHYAERVELEEIRAAAAFAEGLNVVANFRPGRPPIPVIQAADIRYPPKIDVDLRKRIFFDTLRPIVRWENAQVALLRSRLTLARHDGTRPGWVARTARDYGVDWTGKEWDELLARVDTVPLTLVLVQAAKESGWGRSRFARTGNNIFGQWCFVEGCGMVPLKRLPGKTHEVASFGSVNEAVRAYLHNINTGNAYDGLRAVRAKLRARRREPTGSDLAGGLLRYSERGQAYVDELRAMIRVNRALMLGAASGR